MTETFQITPEQAAAYEELFVPALFAQWAPMMVDLAGVREGHRVLDVACGTGVAARRRPTGSAAPDAVVGLDLNPAMLEVAARVRPDIEWREGDVSELPFEARELRRGVVSVGVFFFPDVTRPSRRWPGSCDAAVWWRFRPTRTLADQSGYQGARRHRPAHRAG